MDSSPNKFRAENRKMVNCEEVAPMDLSFHSHYTRTSSISASASYPSCSRPEERSARASGKQTSSRMRRHELSSLRNSSYYKQSLVKIMKHKRKYGYMFKRKSVGSRTDSGVGSASMIGTSRMSRNETCNSDTSTSSLIPSSSPSSSFSGCTSCSPIHETGGNQVRPEHSIVMRQAVPLVLLIQDQVQKSSSISSEPLTFRCNMCNLSSVNITEVLVHIQNNHSTIQYCFQCSRFLGDHDAYLQHSRSCVTMSEALHKMIDDNYATNQFNRNKSDSEELALDLTTEKQKSPEPMRPASVPAKPEPQPIEVPAQISPPAKQLPEPRSLRGNKSEAMKCSFCNKTFFGSFYLKRHLRSHTGEKICHCSVCGKGFAESRNLKNHMNRFHPTSDVDSGRPTSKTSLGQNNEQGESSQMDADAQAELLADIVTLCDGNTKTGKNDGQMIGNSEAWPRQAISMDNQCIISPSGNGYQRTTSVESGFYDQQGRSVSDKAVPTMPSSQLKDKRESSIRAVTEATDHQGHIDHHQGSAGDATFHCSPCNFTCLNPSDTSRHCNSKSHLVKMSALDQHQIGRSQQSGAGNSTIC